jgi:hypothetical protein
LELRGQYVIDRLLEGNAFVNHIDVLLSQTHRLSPTEATFPRGSVGMIKNERTVSSWVWIEIFASFLIAANADWISARAVFDDEKFLF